VELVELVELWSWAASAAAPSLGPSGVTHMWHILTPVLHRWGD